jgi:hypothetical protein
MHIISRTQLLTWLADHPPNRVVQRAIDRGKVTVHGLFKGGWVVEAEYLEQSYVIGIKPVGVESRLICGLLKRVPVGDYVGGDSPLSKGDRDETF